jgi:fatty-acyl-CoA synthase
MCGAPIVYNMLINAPEAPKGGHARPGGRADRRRGPADGGDRRGGTIGIRINHVYGLTEVYGPAAVCAQQPGWEGLPIDERARLNRRQGVPYHLQEAVTVMDPRR